MTELFIFQYVIFLLNNTHVVLGLFPIKIVISIVLWSCILKLGVTIFIAFPSTLVVILLKKLERLEDEKQKLIFNPFQSKNELIKSS